MAGGPFLALGSYSLSQNMRDLHPPPRHLSSDIYYLWVFFWKNRRVFWKKNLIFSKETKGSKFAVKCVSNGIISENVLSDLIMSFSAKSQKTLNGGKSENYDEETVFFREKKRLSIFLKTFFTKMGMRNICRW